MACVLSSARAASYIDMEVDSNCQCGITKTSNNSYSIFILAFDGNVNCHGTTSTRAIKIRNSCSRLQDSLEQSKVMSAAFVNGVTTIPNP